MHPMTCRALVGKRMTSVVTVAVALMLGCAHVAVRDLGVGRHALTAVAPSGAYAGSHGEAVEEANEFCGRSRQTAVIERFEDSPTLGPLGEHTGTAVFACAYRENSASKRKMRPCAPLPFRLISSVYERVAATVSLTATLAETPSEN